MSRSILKAAVFLFTFVSVFILGNSAHGDKQSSSLQSIFEISDDWKDDQNQTVRLSQFKDKHIVITMSYTSCKKICPQLTNTKLQEVEKYYQTTKTPAEFIIVSFDPENDTPKILAEYRKAHGFTSGHWHFLTGNLEATKSLARKLGLGGFFQMESHIVHDFKIVLLEPNGKSAEINWDQRDVSAVVKSLKLAP